jgi:uncharacterized protein (TIGR01777 family)
VIALQHHAGVTGVAGIHVVQNLDLLPDDLQLDAIVNLAGARILGAPWTRARRNQLLSSRLDTTASLVRLVARLAVRPAVLVSASAVGYYGIHGSEPLDEEAAGQPIFQSQLCQRWEQAAQLATEHGVRVATLRFGVVLGLDGGALPALLRPARLGLSAVLGTGRQGMPWIHIEDALRLIEHAIGDHQLQGAVNAVAPEHVTQREFQQGLASVLHRPLWLRLPAWPLRLMLGEMSQLLLDGQHVVPRKCQQHGFWFKHPRLRAALADLLSGGKH